MATNNKMEHKDVRLGKRLAYLLRYGAEKEGLAVKEGGMSKSLNKRNWSCQTENLHARLITKRTTVNTKMFRFLLTLTGSISISLHYLHYRLG